MIHGGAVLAGIVLQAGVAVREIHARKSGMWHLGGESLREADLGQVVIVAVILELEGMEDEPVLYIEHRGGRKCGGPVGAGSVIVAVVKVAAVGWHRGRIGEPGVREMLVPLIGDRK